MQDLDGYEEEMEQAVLQASLNKYKCACGILVVCIIILGILSCYNAFKFRQYNDALTVNAGKIADLQVKVDKYSGLYKTLERKDADLIKASVRLTEKLQIKNAELRKELNNFRKEMFRQSMSGMMSDEELAKALQFFDENGGVTISVSEEKSITDQINEIDEQLKNIRGQ